jgi:hypothetical protein
VRALIVAITAQFPVAVRPSFGKRLLRAFVRVGIGIAILHLLFYLFGPPLFIFYMTRREAKVFPYINVTPQPLKDSSVSDAPGKVISYFGYELTVPWNTNFKEVAPASNGFVALKFESDTSMIFQVAADQDGLLTELVKDPKLNMKSLQEGFPDLLKRSAYDQYDALYSVTPASIHAFGPRVEATRGMLLLTLKLMAAPAGLESRMFRFEFPGMHGFQIGDPQKTNRTTLDIFDINGHNVEIRLFTRDTNRLTQPEVNRILASLHAVPPKPTLTPVTIAATPHK